MNLQDKVAIVTGGASGLGAACIRAFHAKGAKVAIFDRNAALGQELAQSLGGNAIFREVNVADEASVEAGIASVREAFGRVDVCVNCAGIPDPGKTVSKGVPLALEKFKRVIDVNLNGTFNMIRLTAAEMAKNEPNADGERGVIINTASVAATEGQMGQAAYAASKSGVVGLTRPVSRDLSGYGIRVNTFSPGLFATGMSAGLPPPIMDGLVSQLEFPKRAGRPEEYAGLAVHVVENAYINGAVFRIDAGGQPPAR